MKTMKQFLITILLISISTTTFGKEGLKVKGDTVRMRIENFLLEVSTLDLKKNTLEKAEIPTKLQTLLSAIENIEIEEPEVGEKIIISYSDFIGDEVQEFKNLEMSLEKGNTKSLVISDGEYLEKDFGNVTLEMEDSNYKIRLYIDKLEDAAKLDVSKLSAKLAAADSEIPESRKKTNGWLIENNKGEFNSHFIGEVPPLTLDMIELNAGVGVGLIKNQLVSSFKFKAGLAFAKKGIMKNKYFAEYEVLYDFSQPNGGSTFSTNGFLSLGYEKNFSLDPNNAKWYGVSVGYLLDRNNTFFEKNTFKLAIHKQINNSITLKPEIYFNDFFKNGSPALRVQIAF